VLAEHCEQFLTARKALPLLAHPATRAAATAARRPARRP
jgi:hypothetical protein